MPLTTLGGPIISRRYSIFGDAGTLQRRTFFHRSFESGLFPDERSAPDRIVAVAQSLAAWPRTSNRGAIVAESTVHLDPFAQGFAAIGRVHLIG